MDRALLSYCIYCAVGFLCHTTPPTCALCTKVSITQQCIYRIVGIYLENSRTMTYMHRSGNENLFIETKIWHCLIIVMNLEHLNTIGACWYFERVLVPLRLKNQSLYHKILLLQKFNDKWGKVLKPKKISLQPQKKNEAVYDCV